MKQRSQKISPLTSILSPEGRGNKLPTFFFEGRGNSCGLSFSFHSTFNVGRSMLNVRFFILTSVFWLLGNLVYSVNMPVLPQYLVVSSSLTHNIYSLILAVSIVHLIFRVFLVRILRENFCVLFPRGIHTGKSALWERLWSNKSLP